MAKDYQIGVLWIGGALSYLEQLCLKSFLDRGQPVRFYSYEPVTNAPEGVELRDAAEVLAQTGFLRHARTGSPALHSDLFRYHMLAQNEDLIWADTDAYCVKPFHTSNGHFYAWESAHGLNGGVLGLPRDSDTLGRLLDFTADEFAIPPWFSPDEQDRLRALRDAGTPLHAAEQPWGVWGPAALTHFLKATGEVRFALPQVALYPFHYRDRREMLRPGVKMEDYVTDETFSIHFYGRRMRARILQSEPAGIPKPRSVVGRLLRAHGIDPERAPLKRPQPVAEPEPEGLRWDHALARPAQLASVADVTGRNSADLLAIHQACGAQIHLFPAGRGTLFDAPAAARATRERLIVQGVPADAVRIIADVDEVQPVDLVLNLDGFGARWRRPLPEALMQALLHGGSLLLSDVQRGSGALGWLRGLGRCDTLAEAGGLLRVVTRPEPAVSPVEGWSEIARSLAGPEGFFEDLGHHSFLYVPRSQDVLVVTFDNLDIAMGKREDRRPWGYGFIEAQGWSMLGVMAVGWTWYRERSVEAVFERLEREGFFRRFRRVVFYGASMGGYAAAAFSAVAPGADVVAISPQSSLDRTLVPWESRYKSAWGRDWSGRFGDAARACAMARRVVLIHDPFERLDAAHIARFQGANLIKLTAPLMGHRVGSALGQMGLLSPLILRALEGELTAGEFHRALRARRDFPRYQRELYDRARARGHTRLARAMAESVLARMDNPALRKALARAH